MARYYYGPRAGELPGGRAWARGGGVQRDRLPRRGTERKYAQERDKRVALEGGAGRFDLGAGGVGGHEADRDARAAPGPRHGQGEPLPDVVARLPVVGCER